MVKRSPAFLLPALANRGRKKSRGFESIVQSFCRVEEPMTMMSKSIRQDTRLRSGLIAETFPQRIRTVGPEKRFYGGPGHTI